MLFSQAVATTDLRESEQLLRLSVWTAPAYTPARKALVTLLLSIEQRAGEAIPLVEEAFRHGWAEDDPVFFCHALAAAELLAAAERIEQLRRWRPEQGLPLPILRGVTATRNLARTLVTQRQAAPAGGGGGANQRG